MQIPSEDPSGYCRLCFTQQQLRWFLQTSEDPMVALVQACLGLTLVPEIDFPCAVCRLCSAALETFEALRERALACDAVLKSSRRGAEMPPPPPAATTVVDTGDVVECKKERLSPEPESEVVIEHVIPVSEVREEQPNGTVDNSIMVGDIKVELLNIRPKAKFSIKSSPNKEGASSKGPFECHLCKQVYAKKMDLDKHIRLKHSATAKKRESETMAAAVAAKLLRNPQTRPGEFKPISPKDIRRQMELDSATPKPNYYVCSLCGAKFSQRHLFTWHNRTHEKPNQQVGAGGQAISDLPDETPSS